MKDLLKPIVNYRLGYAPTRPYAWRWTTPVACGVFLVATIILALINVPLSAYTIVTEATYTPNASLPVLPLSGLVPSILQESSYSGSFSPQTLTSGQIIRPNGSIYSYNITGAYNGFDTTQPVTSFLYYNNPLSDSCDITTMTIQAEALERIQGSVQITCWTPIVYALTLDVMSAVSLGDSLGDQKDIRSTSLIGFYRDLQSTWLSWGLISNGTNLPGVQVPRGSAQSGVNYGNLTSFVIRVRPCCDCHGIGDTTWNTEIFSLDYPPCSEGPASFLSLDTNLYSASDIGPVCLSTGSIPTDFFYTGENIFNGTAFAALNTLLHNLCQVLYHTIRLDLGISQPNQIFTSADMYNRSISTVYIPDEFFEGGEAPYEATFANISRQDSFNLTTLWTAEQQDVVRVPVMSYMRTVPRLKPLGAAITSVFVSTFAMVSVLWHVFSFIAAALSGKKSDDKENESLRETVEQMRETIEQMRETIEQMRRGLDKHGLIVDDEESEDMNSWKTSHDNVSLMRRYSRVHNKTYSNA
ncbi:hypothetical protein B0H14DRAFT_3126500 [Mycena olivaceomarginata]|nr:hypothetical protein B0H14DRAFT_3126500 [Mycena olivaceomarginata]